MWVEGLTVADGDVSTGRTLLFCVPMLMSVCLVMSLLSLPLCCRCVADDNSLLLPLLC